MTTGKRGRGGGSNSNGDPSVPTGAGARPPKRAGGAGRVAAGAASGRGNVRRADLPPDSPPDATRAAPCASPVEHDGAAASEDGADDHEYTEDASSAVADRFLSHEPTASAQKITISRRSGERFRAAVDFPEDFSLDPHKVIIIAFSYIAVH